jgi:hypothetical protein
MFFSAFMKIKLYYLRYMKKIYYFCKMRTNKKHNTV